MTQPRNGTGSKELALCVTFKVRPEFDEEFAHKFEQTIVETRKDKGVIIFNGHRVSGQTTWVLYEIWESVQDSDTHKQKPDVQAFFADWPRLLAEQPQMLSLEPSIAGL
jgi:quinol monooxygenase YgiN